jgi:O-antigen/teichoic acid export membrane protein
MQIAYNRLDVVLIAALSSAAVVGFYGPASRLQDTMYIIPNIASAVLLPHASRLYVVEQGRPHGTRVLWGRLVVAAMGVSIVAAALISFLAPMWIPRLLGSQYAPSVLPIQVIVWSVPLIAFNNSLAAVISGRHKAGFVTAGIAGALLVLGLIDILLVPAWGAPGAAVGATVREVPLALALLAGGRASGLFSRSIGERNA